jgi:hypothetical protein
MAETQNVAEELQQQTTQVTANDLAKSLWQETPIAINNPSNEEILDKEKGTIAQENLGNDNDTPKQTTTEVDYNAYVKETFGFDNVDVAKQEIENLKKLKDQKPQFEFTNEDSKKLYEALVGGKEDDVYSYLAKKKEFERLSNAEVNENTALDILKLNYKTKNSELTESEVDFLIKKQYSIPKEPIQKDEELDDDFEERKNEWKEKVAEIKQELIINAKLAKKDIEQLKSNIVLPSFEEQKQSQQIDPKELEQQEKIVKAFQNELESSYKSYQGVSVKAKCEDAEFVINYNPKDDEKLELKEKMSKFDLEGYFNPRWLKEDGSINTSKMMDDLYWLENKEAILQKTANESAAQMSLFIKQKNSNIKLNTTATTQQTFNPDAQKTELQKLADAVFQ